MLFGPAGWVLKCDGHVRVVNERYNYLGHKKGRNRTPDHLGKWLNQPYS